MVARRRRNPVTDAATRARPSPGTPHGRTGEIERPGAEQAGTLVRAGTDGIAAFLSLQRFVGNQATIRAIADGPRSPRANPVIQRVGEPKRDVTLVDPGDDAIVQDGVDLLNGALEAMRSAQRQHKADLWTNTIGPASDTTAPPPTGFSRAYAEGLNQFSKLGFLRQRQEFIDGRLRFSPKAPQPPERIFYVTQVGGANRSEQVASIDARQYAEAGNAGRQIFENPIGGKQYVKDDRDVPTRRYAYVEKSFHQFMEYLVTRRLEGRFQRFWAAAHPGALRPDPRVASDQLALDIIPGPANPGDQLTHEQLAYLHQWQGSGIQQRGLSLTSTPKSGKIIGNKGENFRTDGGVRIKIDLASITPGTAILLNHYAEGGVKSGLAGVNKPLPFGRTTPYKYLESVTKNRELFLETLDAAWIVDIEIHPNASDQPGTGASTVLAPDDANLDDHLADYSNGFQQQAAAFNAPLAADETTAGGKGVLAARDYAAGHAEGTQDRLADQAAHAAPPADPLAWDTLDTKEHYDIWLIGRIHGRTGRPRATTLADVYA